jgi:hypothetical protein
VLDGINTVTVPLDGSAPGAPASMRLEGFDGDNLVAADTLTLN